MYINNLYPVISTYNRDITECIFLLYGNTNEYNELRDIFIKIRVDNNRIFQNISKELNDVILQIINKENEFCAINNLLKERELLRKDFEHYTEKINHLKEHKIHSDKRSVEKYNRVKL
jgi:hypothetical protein